jgi:hypothetical protein
MHSYQLDAAKMVPDKPEKTVLQIVRKMYDIHRFHYLLTPTGCSDTGYHKFNTFKTRGFIPDHKISFKKRRFSHV